MSISRYQQEIGLGLQTVTGVAAKIHEAKADDGKIDAGEALSIFSGALMQALMGYAAIQADKK